jgi:hypothetical protein
MTNEPKGESEDNGGSNGEDAKSKLLTAMVNAGSGVLVVIVALIVLTLMTSYLVSAVNSDDAKLAISTTALGVIGTIIGAFFGVKSATDSRKDAQQQSNDQVDKTTKLAKEAVDKATQDTKEANEKLTAAVFAADPNDTNLKDALNLK